MSALLEIENTVKNFSDVDLANFRDWFVDFDGKNWDKQFERDVLNGKLSNIAENAINDFVSDKFIELCNT